MDRTPNGGDRQGPRLIRTTFKTSRLLDFCSEKELTAQVGHDRHEWPLVILKELVDNALDVCEEAGAAPDIKVAVDASGITVTDNGPGLPAATIQDLLDFSIRVSSREAYCSPTRGAQGNALKTVLAMPFVLDGTTGRVDIVAHGQRHEITFAVDQIRQEPVISVDPEPAADVKNGTTIKVWWPNSACSILEDAKARFLQLADDFTFLNPHLTVSVNWFGSERRTPATTPTWKKWLPSDPTSPHWYSQEGLERLVAAYITYDQDQGKERSVRELVKEFRGLTGTAKQKEVLEATELARVNLSALANGHGMEHEVIEKLLGSMKVHSKPVKPAALGVIGEDHIRARFEALACVMESFNYRKVAQIDDDGLPVVIETAFGWRGDDCHEPRRLITGVNWSPGIVNPFRSLGKGYGDGLASLLEKGYAGRDEPIVFLLHCACPRVQYTDRGKSAVVIE
jgi:DNA topoisomerase VI subunit B